jgi:hypothetical protein
MSIATGVAIELELIPHVGREVVLILGELNHCHKNFLQDARGTGNYQLSLLWCHIPDRIWRSAEA